MGAEKPVSPLDVTLLRGFRFGCRPDCGLCCYAEPRVEADERPALLQIAASAEIEETRGGSFLASRPDGGACQFLSVNQCRVWSARPAPCREFPITVHVAERLQASLVLSCPGLDLYPLLESASWESRPPPAGLESELGSAVGRAQRLSVRRRATAAQRRQRIVASLERAGHWVSEEEIREDLHRRIPLPAREDFPVPDPPAPSEGLENLPLFFDHRAGPVALAAGLGGWELLELRAEGGAESLGVVPPPDAPPAVTDEGEALLRGYLGYFIERDALFGSVVPEFDPATDGSLPGLIETELRSIGANVLSRADVRRRAFRGVTGPLTERDVADGIRSTDQDLLDRPTWGERL